MTLITRKYRMGEIQAMHATHSDLLDWLYVNIGPKTGEPPEDWCRVKPFNDKSRKLPSWNNLKLLYFVTRGIPDLQKTLHLLPLSGAVMTTGGWQLRTYGRTRVFFVVSLQ
jgi:hypothetical protein